MDNCFCTYICGQLRSKASHRSISDEQTDWWRDIIILPHPLDECAEKDHKDDQQVGPEQC